MASTNFNRNDTIPSRDGNSGHPSGPAHAEAETAVDTTEAPRGPRALRSGHQQHSMELIEGGRSATAAYDPLLTPEQVAKRLNTSLDWVWDHSSRKLPLLPVIRFGDGPGRAGLLRYRASKIEEFIAEQEHLSYTRRKNSRRRIARPTCSPTEAEE